MLKLICVIWISFIITYLIPYCTTFTCMHDQVVEKRPTFVTRSVKYKDIVKEREKNRTQFEPLQVYFYIDNLETSVSANVIYNIELALRKVRDYLAKTFQVYRRKSPFVLERQSCVRRWHAGPNNGKCSKLSGEPEVCITQEITYPISARFLDKLEIFDYEGETPRHQINSGTGLLRSNFITFITSESSSICEGSDVSAFGTYCRLDKDTNEPLAGILNFCPAYFANKIYPPRHYYNIILHEMFHILGFSIHLFEKFLPCQKGVHCDVPKNIIETDSYDIPRLMFPLVIEHMQDHFSCNDSDFGGPLVVEVNNSTEEEEEEDETKQFTSHWDPVLMYSSLMMPKFSEYDHIFVDNITLSVFASTGWYHVNYFQADDFRFGKGEGCEFGVNSTCDNVFLCDPKSDNKLGCDIVHRSIGKCSDLSSNSKCGVYQPYDTENCDLKLGNQYGLDFYALGYQHKCLMLYDEDNDTTPSCLPIKCKTNDNYDILINMTWYECFSQEMVSTKNISVFCPEVSLLCTGNRTTTVRQFCPAEENFFIAVRMSFKKPTFGDLHKNQDFKNFKVTTLKRFAEKIDMPVNYIVNSSLSVFKKVQLSFAICPTSVKNASSLSNIIHKVQKFLDSDNFMHIFGQSNMIVSATNVKIDPSHAIGFTDHEGFRTLLIFPAICIIFLVSTVVASLMRFLVFSKR